MTPSSFLNCLSYNGIFTGTSGSIVGIYDLGSGSGISGIFFNLAYPTGTSFSGNQIYGPSVPLVAVGQNISNYQFTGVNAYRIGYTFSGDFGIILDVDYSGCARSTTGRAYTLLSTSDYPTGLSGTFLIGVNEANRLYFETSGFTRTLAYELRNRNLVYAGMGNRNNIEFGVWDYLNQTLVSEAFSLDLNQSLVNKIYLGSYLNYTGNDYTGYFGKINNVVIADKPFIKNDISNCANCLFVTGQTTGAPTIQNVTIPTITGYVVSGVSGQVITGWTTFTGVITKSDNTTVNVVFPSGLTGAVKIEDLTSVLTGTASITITGDAPAIFYTDPSKTAPFLSYDIEFDFNLESGDYVEIQTFSAYNSKIGLDILNLDYPQTTSFVQVIGNGLAETKDADYIVDREKISGFLNDDILIYDLFSGASIVSAFSGFWTTDKLAMSGGTFYPPTSQFGEASGTLVFSGLKGFPITFDSELFMNGQKLTSGYNYKIFSDTSFMYFGGITGLVVVEMYPSTLPSLVVNGLYSPTGGLATGLDPNDPVEDGELTIFTGYGSYNGFAYDITGETNKITGISGFSEKVYVNGLRQRFSSDYTKDFSCSLTSGFVTAPSVPFAFYNDEGTYFNI